MHRFVNAIEDEKIVLAYALKPATTAKRSLSLLKKLRAEHYFSSAHSEIHITLLNTQCRKTLDELTRKGGELFEACDFGFLDDVSANDINYARAKIAVENIKAAYKDRMKQLNGELT